MQQLDSIPNIRIRDLGSLPVKDVETYARYLKYLVPKDRLGNYKASNLYDLEFAEVVNIRDAINSGDMVTAMSIFFKCPVPFLIRFRLIPYSHALNYMIKMVDQLNTREAKALKSEPDQKLVEAGVKELDRFGPLNILDDLGKEFGKSPTEIEKWSYGLIFGLLWRRSIKSEINERYMELTKKS